jgi:hypothetical protein
MAKIVQHAPLIQDKPTNVYCFNYFQSSPEIEILAGRQSEQALFLKTVEYILILINLVFTLLSF